MHKGVYYPITMFRIASHCDRENKGIVQLGLIYVTEMAQISWSYTEKRSYLTKSIESFIYNILAQLKNLKIKFNNVFITGLLTLLEFFTNHEMSSMHKYLFNNVYEFSTKQIMSPIMLNCHTPFFEIIIKYIQNGMWCGTCNWN